jgi:hypothetical protein
MNQNQSLWTALEKKQITRDQLQPALFKKLGQPQTELQSNLAQELIKKIVNYYYPTIPQEQNYTIYSVVGPVQEIIQKQRKEGPRKGQIFYVLILGSKDTRSDRVGSPTKLHAYQENLKEPQWSQITNLGLLGQNLVFQYRKQFFNREILG